MELWKAQIQVEQCRRIMASMENPFTPDAVILFRNALATLREAKARTRQRRDEPAPVDSPYLTPTEAARYLRLAYSTFRKRATRIKRCPQTGKYLRTDLDSFAESFRPKRKR